MKKKIGREGERNNLLCMGKLCIEWESELQIYSKRIGIRRVKNKKKTING